MLVALLIVVFALCFGVFNYWFQKEKYKRLTKEETGKLNVFNSPTAWLLYSLIFFLGVLGIISYYAYRLMSAIMNMR